MSMMKDENGIEKWNPDSEFTDEEREMVNKSGLTVPQLRDFWGRFPHQSIDTAIGGCLDELKAKEAGETPALEKETEEVEPVAEDDPKEQETPMMDE